MPARTLVNGLRSIVVVPIALVGLLALGPVGCGQLDKHRNQKIPQYGYVDPHQPRELQKVSMPLHVVEPPDELQISVRPLALGTVPSNVQVRADGHIDLEFFGDVYVAGLTLHDVERKLLLRFLAAAAEKKIEDPVEVSVRLIDASNSKRYYVLGTVTTPNSFPLKGNETVLDGILQAGLRSNSLPDKAYLVRPHPAGGPDQVLKVDWFGITERGDTMTNYQLMPGDRIYVPGGRAPGLVKTLFGGG